MTAYIVLNFLCHLGANWSLNLNVKTQNKIVLGKRQMTNAAGILDFIGNENKLM